MMGGKPSCESLPDGRARGDATLEPPREQAGNAVRPANGVVLAMHCVPADVDPSVEMFWSRLAAALARRGRVLVLLSTASVADPALQVVGMPFALTAFARHYAAAPAVAPSAGIDVDEESISDAVAWYRCAHSEAQDNLRVATAFLRDLLDALRPVAVLGWQSANPLTRLLRKCTRGAEIPWWSGERGWVRGTLMFDLGGPHVLGELRTSLAGARQRRGYHPTPEMMAHLRQRATQAANLGRYAEPRRLDRNALRAKLGIPADAPVSVLFTHGEPYVNSMGIAAVREFHGMSTELLQARFDGLCAALSARGHWLLVQEHPFNVRDGRCLRLPEQPNVVRVQENVRSLLDAADVCFFTLATLQFDAVFLDKPIGLLARSALYREGVPPFVGDFEDVDAFVDAVLDAAAWPERFERLRTEVAFIYEHLLLDVQPDVVETSAAEWAGHLAQFSRPVDAHLRTRVARFLDLWTPRAQATW